jgi:hypothetical protein
VLWRFSIGAGRPEGHSRHSRLGAQLMLCPIQSNLTPAFRPPAQAAPGAAEDKPRRLEEAPKEAIHRRFTETTSSSSNVCAVRFLVPVVDEPRLTLVLLSGGGGVHACDWAPWDARSRRAMTMMMDVMDAICYCLCSHSCYGASLGRH